MPHHIHLHVVKLPALFPAGATAFVTVDDHVTAHFGGEVFNVDEPFDVIARALQAPSIEELCGALISAVSHAVGSLDFLAVHPRMPAGERRAHLAALRKVLAESLPKKEAA